MPADRNLFRFQHKLPQEIVRAVEASRHKYSEQNGGVSIAPEAYLEILFNDGFTEISKLVSNNKYLESDFATTFAKSFGSSSRLEMNYFLNPQIMAKANNLRHALPRERHRKARVYVEGLIRGLMKYNVIGASDGRFLVLPSDKWNISAVKLTG